MVERWLTLKANDRNVGFGLSLDPEDTQDNFILSFLEAGQVPEPELLWVMSHVLHEGDFALDIGANIGFYTLFMSRLVGATGLVFAAEPGFNNLPTLAHHIKINGIRNVQVIEKPFWCRVEPVTFYINSDSRGSNALFDPGNWPMNEKSRANPQPIAMEATTIDTLEISKERLRLIKIDTEGAEQKILEGASKTLEKYHPPYILSELNPHGMAQAGCDTEGFRSFMRKYGYEMFLIHSEDKLPSLVPPNTRMQYLNDSVICNVLFSTFADVAAAWPEVMGNG